MFRGLYTAANGMIAKQHRIETIANNLANVDTTGYKKDDHITEAFSEKLLYKRHDSEGVLRAIPNWVSSKNTTLENGANELEMTIKRGYIMMEDDTGRGYYKAAKVARDEDGYLRTVYRDYNSKVITKFGAYMLDENGNRVKVPEGTFKILPDGSLAVGGNPIAKVIIPEARGSIGTINGGAMTDRTMTNYTQGSLDTTDNPMHIALEGEGFLKVLIGDTGKYKYSRAGAMTMDKDGVLKDYTGNTFVGVNSSPIKLPLNSKQIEIKEDGSIYYLDDDNNMQYVDTFDIVDIANKEDLRKHGLSYYEAIPGNEIEETPYNGKVLQGYLERSNVSNIDEMVQMIEAQRGFESDQKVIQVYDQIMQNAANEIGKI